MARYNVNTVWDDPFERQREQRSAMRFELRIAVTLALDDPVTRRRLAGPGRVRNISQSGLLFVANHPVEAVHRIALAIPTEFCPEDLCLPKRFSGPAEVVRSKRLSNGLYEVAARFSDSFTQNMEFALFIDALQRTMLALRS